MTRISQNGRKGVEWLHLVYDMSQWRVIVDKEMSVCNVFTSCEIIILQEDLLYIVSTYLSLSPHLFYYFITSYSLFLPRLLPSFFLREKPLFSRMKFIKPLLSLL